MNSVTAYLNQIDAALEKGDSTEHTHRPALKSLVESLGLNIIATNEPKRIACGAPDFSISSKNLTLGYIEAKDIGCSLKEALQTDQLKRYLKSIDNIILTDYVNFIWFTSGEMRLTAQLANLKLTGKLERIKEGPDDLKSLLSGFFEREPQTITSPKSLAERMARITHLIRDIIVASFEKGEASAWIRGWRKAFTDVLIADLDQPQRTSEFADMFAQTLSYGLFTACVMNSGHKTFTRSEAQRLIPRSNPFLRNFFMDISSLRLEEEPFSSFVDDLVRLLAHTDMEKVLVS